MPWVSAIAEFGCHAGGVESLGSNDLLMTSGHRAEAFLSFKAKGQTTHSMTPGFIPWVPPRSINTKKAMSVLGWGKERAFHSVSPVAPPYRAVAITAHFKSHGFICKRRDENARWTRAVKVSQHLFCFKPGRTSRGMGSLPSSGWSCCWFRRRRRRRAWCNV